MGFTVWKDAPDGKIQKFDVSVAKNYLTEKELFSLERMVSAYLDIAEDMATRYIPMTMTDWTKRLNRLFESDFDRFIQLEKKVKKKTTPVSSKSKR